MTSHLEQRLIYQLTAFEVKPPVQEYRFAAEYVGLGRGVRERLRIQQLRDWRFDFAWPEYKFAVEVEGITPEGGGRHQRIRGFNGDLKKYHAAMQLGWTIYRTGDVLIKTGQSVQLIRNMIEAFDNEKKNG